LVLANPGDPSILVSANQFPPVDLENRNLPAERHVDILGDIFVTNATLGTKKRRKDRSDFSTKIKKIILEKLEIADNTLFSFSEQYLNS
jgi:hypothetical protein